MFIRSLGISDHALWPSRSISHSAVGEVALPGKRQPNPTTAIGSIASTVDESLILSSQNLCILVTK